MKPVLFLIVLSMVNVVVHGNALGLEPRTKGGYLQKGNSNATFTAYSGCSTPGKHKPVVSHKNARTNTGIPCSVRKSLLWLHRCDKPAFIWSARGPRCRGRMRALLQDNWYWGPVLAAVYWSILQHSRKGHQFMPLPRRREMVRPVALPPSEPIWCACAVSDCALPLAFHHGT